MVPEAPWKSRETKLVLSKRRDPAFLFADIVSDRRRPNVRGLRTKSIAWDSDPGGL